jgi:hypothetical protein
MIAGRVVGERRASLAPMSVLGHLADICSAKGHVRFAPDNNRESGLPQPVMSALPPRAMCGANHYVCFGPIADICVLDGQTCKAAPRNDNRPNVRATSTSSALFVSRRFLIGAKSLQQSAARWLIVAFAKRPCASSKRQMWNGVAQIFDAALRLRCLACTRPRLDANATQQSELSRFLKRSKPTSNL